MTESDVSGQIGMELLSDTVKRILLTRIMQGHYQPGERIVELQVAKELGTSQSPVREALRDLAAIGVITFHSRRGARVRQPTSKELADVSLVRSEIDALAARLMVERVTGDEVAELQTKYDEMQTHLASRDYVSMTASDARFHQIIAAGSNNLTIEHVFDQLEPFARTFITLTLPNVDIAPIIAEHGGILDAIRQRDPELASHRARQHQLNVSALFREHFPA